MSIQESNRIVLKKAGSIIITLLLIFAIFIVILVAAGPFLGIRTSIVLSGSMEPAINTGSVIITRPIAPEAIHVGDIISFSSRSGTFVTTHRVIGIEQNPELLFITKGDANRGKDPAPISPDQVLGKLFLVLPGLGYLISYIKNPVALIILIVVPLVIVLGFELDKRWIRGEK
jgi:signal peptidase